MIGPVLLALAQGLAAGDAADLLKRADLDDNGAVDAGELVEMKKESFRRLDRDGDGYLTSRDTPRLMKRRGGDPVERLSATHDRDGDGRLSYREFVYGPTPMFHAADADGDGVLTRNELDSLPSR